MARLRLVFALLAAAIFAATGLLAARALRAAEVERAARHETLAERLFDEMERALSDFLRREEERPVGHYTFTYAAEGARADRPAWLRSPLSRLVADADAPFVVGWFQVEPDGRVLSPLLPRDEDPASGAPPDAVARETAARVRAIVERALAVAPGARLADAAPPPQEADRLAEAPRDRPAPPAVPPPAAKVAKQALQAKQEAEAPAASAYDALQSLNRGALERQGRERKVLAVAPAAESALGEAGAAAAPREPTAARSSTAPPAPAFADAPLAPQPAPGVAPGRAYEARDAQPRAELAPSERLAQPAERATSGASAPRSAKRDAPLAPPPAALPPRSQPPARVAVDPFVGRLAGDHLLLLRTVWVGERGQRQGLVLDVARLAQWLRDRALGGGALPAVRLAFAPGGELASGDVGAHPFRASHRFAEPFDALGLELALAPLRDGPGERVVLALAGLLVLAAAAGLFALYRMVAVRLAFAQRRSNFAAAVSHELKTPLTAIRMYVEMLRDGLVPTEEKRREYYATLGAESERLSRLIDNVLEFSRLERGTRSVELQAVSLAPLVEELAALLRPHAERQGFRLELALDPDLPPVRCERDALAQILFNLVENALKYARSAGGRTIRIACARERGRVALSVRDYGPGVPERRLARIFEPFYRGEDELTRETRGSGIGLALVEGLAERMGATVSASNPPGGGLEVTLSFPPAL